MNICDLHCDTLTKCFDNSLQLNQNNLHIDFHSLNKFSRYTQFFAVFIAPKYYSSPKKRCLDVINYFYNQLALNNMPLSKNFDDINNTEKLTVFLSVEGGEPITDLKILELFYELGVRMITLTWNNSNHIGGANGSNTGLSAFGKDLILKMNELGIIIDLSHSSEKTFFDTCEITKKPVILSHSNSFELCPHQRNITDKQFKEIKCLNGVVGINFYPPFLSENQSASTNDIVKHIEHFLSLGGEDNICFGSDFDGVDSLPNGISSVRDIDKIFNQLSKRGISNEIIEKIAYKNAYRVLSICL